MKININALWDVACVTREFFQHRGIGAKSLNARAYARSRLKIGLIK